MAGSTPAAELIAMVSGLFGEVYNTHSILEQLLEDVVQMGFHQDNDAALHEGFESRVFGQVAKLWKGTMRLLSHKRLKTIRCVCNIVLLICSERTV